MISRRALNPDQLYELDLELDLIADQDHDLGSTTAAQLRRYVRRLCREMTRTVATVKGLERRGWAPRFSGEGRVALSVHKYPPEVVADLRAAGVSHPALTGWQHGNGVRVRLVGVLLVADD